MIAKQIKYKKLRWAVLGVLRRLLLADARQVPDVEAAVGAGRGNDRLVVRTPLHLEDLVAVRF